jgi:hypothetical protein
MWVRLVLSHVTLHLVCSVALCYESLGTVAVPREWSIVLTFYCSCLYARLAVIDCAVCPHVL